MRHPLEEVPDGQLESLNLLQHQYTNDARPFKADLMCGVYQTEEGTPYVLPSVKKARRIMFEDPAWEHEYPSSHLGTKEFRDLSTRLLFGDDSSVVQNHRIASMQALGASGACHMGALLLREHYSPYIENPSGKVYVPHETWANHVNVFRKAGFDTGNLPYYNNLSHSFDFEVFNATIKQIPAQSIIVLQVCGNNPTGCDPSQSEWQILVQTFLSMRHFAFLDLSYPGFVSGDVEQDCEPIRLFAEAEVPMVVATTYGKAFGLYGERVGHLCMPLPNDKIVARMEKQMKLLARAETGAQPRFGARIVEIILDKDSLRALWQSDLRKIAQSLVSRRHRLRNAIQELATPGDWDFVTAQSGMFLYTSFDSDQIKQLREDHAVYLQDTGRLSIAGLNASNIFHVARSIDRVTRSS